MAKRTNKNVPLEEEKKVVENIYAPGPKEMSVVTATFHKFTNSAADRDRDFEYFDGINLIDYIEDSVRRFTTNIDERDDMEDWQARVNDPFTRNKVLAVLGKVVQVLPIAEFVARGDEDCRKAQILTDLYNYAEDLDDYEELMVHIILEAIVKGTAIGYEGLDTKTKVVKNVEKVGDELTYKAETTTTNRLTGSIIPLEDFYPQNVGMRNIKQMVYCFWRSVVPHQKFLDTWSSYAEARNVQPKITWAGDSKGNRPYYLDFISGNVSDGEVEIIRYYNKDTDEYVIIANGVWLNPVALKETNEISPLPWNHKELPFWDIRFDLFGSDFFYGKSLPDRLKSLQDVLNVLTNMLLDQSFLTIFPPMLTNGFDSIEDDYLRPGRRTPIDTQGVPIQQAFMKLDLGTPSGWHQYILEYTRKIMEQSSLDQVSSGQAGVGGRTTAQEIRVAAEGVTSMLNMFGRMVNYGVKRKAMLKGANILQFWTNANSPMVQKVLGDGSTAEAKEAFNTFKVDGVTLSNGKRGQKIIELYADKDKRPSKAKLKAKQMVYEASNNKNIEFIVVDADYIRSFESDVVVVPNAKKQSSRDIDKALQLEKVRIYMTFFPQQVDIDELAAQTAEKMGDDPQKILKSELFKKDQAPAMAEGDETANQIGTKPEMNMGNNAVRGMMGGEENSMQLRDMQNSMLG